MLLTITTTSRPATDLGFLLHKHPGRVHAVELGFGRAHVVYPQATQERCTAALVVDVDPVGLVRERRRAAGFALRQYVNDRPYAASSFLSVAIGRVFGTALGGRSRERPELAAAPLPLTARLPAVPARGGGADLLTRLFAPLGYRVAATPLPLDPHVPAWGDSAYHTLELSGEVRLRDLLAHLTVLLPVLDDDKHYWVGEDEVDTLLRRGGDWLAAHPERDLIARRSLRHDVGLAREALARLAEDDADPDAASAAQDAEEEAVERPLTLAEQRLAAVLDVLRAAGARRVLDLGCGSGTLVAALLREPWVDRVVGVDVSYGALQAAARRVRLDRMTPGERERVELWQGALTYRDDRLRDFDAAALVEVVEHVDPPRLGAFERVVFGHAAPRTVVLTTPNVEYNPRFEGLPAGTLRHRDHRFEWTRGQLREWAQGVGQRHGYRVRLAGVGPEDPEAGPPTQLAVFSR
jgi:3' terminal RNA ribose 2'-O-methyltransferase Hen1